MKRRTNRRSLLKASAFRELLSKNRAQGWLLVGNITSRILILAAMLVAARLMTTGEFASVAFTQTSLMAAAIAGNFALNTAATRFISRHNSSRAMQAAMANFFQRRTTQVAFTVALALFFGAPLIRNLAPALPDFTAILRISAVSLCFYACSLTNVGILFGFHRLIAIAATLGAQGVVTITAMAPLANAYGAIGASLAFLAGYAAQWMVGRILVRRVAGPVAHSPKASLFLKKLSPRVWSFTFPLFIANALVLPVNWVVQLLVARSHGAADLAILSIALNWYAIILFIPSLQNRIFLPVLAQRGASRGIVGLIGRNALLAIFAALPIFAAADWIASFYSDALKDGGPTIRIFTVVAVLAALSSGTGQHLVAKGKTTLSMKFNFVWAVLVVSLSILLAPKWGSVGVGFGYILAYFVHTTIQLFYIRSELRRTPKVMSAAVADQGGRQCVSV